MIQEKGVGLGMVIVYTVIMNGTALSSPYLNTDTIVAIATGSQHSAIGVVRLSGARARDIIAQVTSKTPSDFVVRKSTLVDFLHPDTHTVIDQGLVTVFAQPASYTGEDVVEFAAHGNPMILEELVRICIALGARLAEPGEFTYRAFRNGKLDLAQAEAVNQLVHASTMLAAQAARQVLGGMVSHSLQSFTDQLAATRIQLEGTIEFPLEETMPWDSQELSTTVTALSKTAQDWLNGCRKWSHADRGFTVALLGPPNVGKSSLYNALLGYARALVTPVPGTTRDTLEEGLSLDGIPVLLVDTAGIGTPRDNLDRLGMERSWQAAHRSDLFVVVIAATELDTSGTQSCVEQLIESACELGIPMVFVINKTDLAPVHELSNLLYPVVKTCALTGKGIDQLTEYIKTALRELLPSRQEPGWMATVRQQELLEELVNALGVVEELLQTESPLELVATELETAHRMLNRIAGTDSSLSVIEQVFERFCIGK